MTTTKTRLPAPEQLLIVPLSEMELAELIEQHIEYVDENGRPVHLQPHFVKHYMKRDDGGLPIITSIAQLPIVLPDGTILTGRGLNRKYGIVFRVPEELDALLPSQAGCTPAAVARAMRFLTDEWLCDVAADYQGKGTIIACALTILERALLPQRPAFFVTAGQRGGGKTTSIHMISMAAVGLPASAAAWSPNEEERRKALFSYLGMGLPLLVWDNIARGSTISCPSIEKSLTTEHYSDRVLGYTEIKTVPTYTVQVFTGNNISPRGDLASRSLVVRLTVNRIDPENRSFAHPDPMGWTNDNRGRILQALYTILLGNPRRSQKKSERSPAVTRFKEWWDMVGSAVEYAGDQHLQLSRDEINGLVSDPHPTCPATPITFKTMLLDAEADEEQTSSLVTVLDALRMLWPDTRQPGNSRLFQAGEVALYAGKAEDASIAFKVALEMAAGKSIKIVSAPVVNWRLQAIADTPVSLGYKTLVLRYVKNDKNGRYGGFRIETMATPSDIPNSES
jgi:hypothetical protein